MTRTSTPSEAPTASSHPSLDEARFVPGAILDDRYRIVGLLGLGGMGEVYRAEDLKLGQAVALKFLPQGLEQDEKRLQRFLQELKIARQVSHSNVCRVYDVGEVDGQHFISMEYVDGEDLSSLLRRIGRLPGDRAVLVARQICAGVAAAHEQQILHRDLKPANVMIDGRGRVKITDFGLAGLAGDFAEGEIRSGTPAYMAPEQLAGQEVTIASDIYSLGLVLYELFTGERAFKAESVTELVRVRTDSSPTNPSNHVEGLDPTVERVILSCLENDPDRRPASALAVSGALPGGDPLAAALAAGETPSPEMIADAGSVGALRPAIAATLLVLILVGLAGRIPLQEKISKVGAVDFPMPPEALTVKAQEIVGQSGFTDPPGDTARGFEYDLDYLEAERDRPPDERWRDLADVRPAPVFFWYRQSPRALMPSLLENFPDIYSSDPPFNVSGMVEVRLDPHGRLLRLSVVPPQVDDSDLATEPDWSPLFASAGLDVNELSAVPASWHPLFPCDQRRAWEGAYPDQPDVKIRVEAGSWRGRAVWFEIVTPWRVAERMEEPQLGAGRVVAVVLILATVFGVLTAGVLLALRNLRLGRGDRRVAGIAARLVFALTFGYWVLGWRHVASPRELIGFFEALVWGLFFAAVTWLIYIAIEPFIRRLWPDLIISWNRLFQGRFRDPLVGRDILVGAAVGVVLGYVRYAGMLLPQWAGLPLAEPHSTGLMSLLGVRQTIAEWAQLRQALLEPFIYLLLLLLLRVVVRRRWAAVAVLTIFFALIFTLSSANPLIDGPLALLYYALNLGVLVRFGMVTFMANRLFTFPGVAMILTADPSSWFFGRTLVLPLLLAALAGYSFYISLAGRPLFNERLLEAEARG